MSFVERLRQELTLEAQRAEQKTVREKADQEAKEKARLQAEVAERERRAPRRQQAEGFREQSGVGAVVADLGAFLAIPTIPVTRDNGESMWTEYIGRGSSSRGIRSDIELKPRDSDSAFDSIVWDYECLGFSPAYVHHSIKFVVVEISPEGTIIFHAGRPGSTTIPVERWKGKEDRSDIFDESLEKAYRHPVVMKYDTPTPPDNTFG